MQTKRLLKLAEFLEKLPKSKFDMSEWMNGCQTAGCAFGWACTIPSFKRAGLFLDDIGWPVFNSVDGYDAASEFFNLTYSETEMLFDPDSYENGSRTYPKTVAKRIRKLCETKK